MIQLAQIELLTSYTDVSPFIGVVINAADGERESFGFLPQRAYEEFALQRRLIIARDPETHGLAGYVVFGGTSPQARIFQTYVAPGYRRKGVGEVLVNEVARRAEEASFLSVRVEIAADLPTANAFYQNVGFKKVRERAGGVSRRRTLITRVRELNTPSLLDFAAYGSADALPVSLSLPTTTRPPLYLLDLNVIFDVAKRRGKALATGRIFAAALDNSVAVAVSSELIDELERTVRHETPDPIYEFARTLPRLKKPAPGVIAAHRLRLAPLLFPNRFASSGLTVQDESDVAHLATAIEEGAGFITSEKAVLACSEWLRENSNIEVISPEVFGKRYVSSTRTSAAYQVQLEGRPVTAGDFTEVDREVVCGLLERLDVPQQAIKEATSQGTSVSARRRLLVRTSEAVIAFGSWNPATISSPSTQLYVFADQNAAAAEAAVDYILDAASRDAAAVSPAVLRLSPSSDQVLVRSRAINLGFRASTRASLRTGELEKLSLGTVVTDQSWAETRKRLIEIAGVELPMDSPLFGTSADRIAIRGHGGQQASTAIGALEDFLSPAIFALSGRQAVIVPIKPRYAEALFRGSRQPSFLDEQQAVLLRRRSYVGSDKTYGALPEQGLIFFYESSDSGLGRSAAIAVARITRRYLVGEREAQALAQERGVLTESEVKSIAKGKQACVTEFDNLMKFQSAVKLSILKELGCADDSNMVTARAIPTEAAAKLIERGVPTCAL